MPTIPYHDGEAIRVVDGGKIRSSSVVGIAALTPRYGLAGHCCRQRDSALAKVF